MITAGIYVRVSTQEQAQEGHSIGEQTERLQTYCSAMGWTVYRVYTDPGYSGGSVDRPALQQMIRDIKDHRINKVVVYKLDRLSRSQKDTLSLIEDTFNRNDVDFISMCENFDTSTPFGRAAIGIMAAFAQLEREQIKERMLMGKEARAKSGKWIGSQFEPIGYRYRDGRLIVDEYEKLQVIKVYDLILSGLSLKAVARRMTADGYRHRYGPWIDTTIKRVAMSRIYTGHISYGDSCYEAQHEAIIDQDVYDKVQNILKEKSKRYENHIRPGRASSYLAGLIVCGNCGARYEKVTQLQRYKYYTCASRRKRTPASIKDPNCKNKSWRMDTLDQLIFDQIRQLAVDPDYKPNQDPVQDESAVIEQEIRKIDSQISRLLDLYGMDRMPVEKLQEKISELSVRRDSLQEQLKEQPEKIDISEAQNLALSFDTILDSGDYNAIREVLFALIDKIVLTGNDIEIHWTFSS